MPYINSLLCALAQFALHFSISAHSQPFYKGLNPTWLQLKAEGQLVGDLAASDFAYLDDLFQHKERFILWMCSCVL